MTGRWVMAGLVLWPLAALAEAPAPDSALDRAMRRDPGRFADRVVELIAGFGGPQGLTLAGIDDHVALERAGARAAALRRFHAMDLDFDGSVDRAEVEISRRAANAAGRGRMERQFSAADSNGDERVDAAELAEQGRLAGLRALDEDEAAGLRGLMALDQDGDGALTADEVAQAVAAVEKAD